MCLPGSEKWHVLLWDQQVSEWSWNLGMEEMGIRDMEGVLQTLMDC